MKMDTILVPTDFSEDAAKALEMAVDLARRLGSRVVLLHAYSIELPFSSPAMGGGLILPEGYYVELRNHATLHVERLAKEASRDGIEVQGKAVENTPWMAIIDEAEALPADLIVMGTRGLTGLKHLALGSVADRVVRKASCPVLTVKAD
ncbi:MAG TPA: universal stress protein [Myxococcota bacterium]|nr:universal stress protein [Myxococcota bacterium]